MASSILRKIDNLLRMSQNNNNIHEASLAAFRAKELAEKYDIALEILSIKGTNNSIDSIIDYIKSYNEPFELNLKKWEEGLLNIVADHYDCKVFSLEKNEQICYNIIGFSRSIEMIDTMFSWLKSQLNIIILQEKDKSAVWQEAYLIGALYQINQKLEEARQTARSSMNQKFNEASEAIVRIDSRQVKINEFLKNKEFENRELKTDNQNAFNKGFEKAKIINLNKEISLQ